MQDDIGCLQSKDIETPTSIIFRHNFCWGFLHKIWQKVVKILLTESNEIQVNQKVDRHGNKYWQAYDPVTRMSFTSGSEVDIRMWIEQIYKYQQTNSSNW
ncbi:MULTISPECIES: hypothetical protein [unclassified Anabaena]|uniref:hypothetical protein n=1 Tax=unclassified Anabaena TaxID=2619674 RepID=UPI002B1F9428|nr:hypothetical protein [Anabaena sp. UHCC 0399]MEA5569105.1 hypothetical protein [Anabaena sp. UHCC 0399]